MADARLAKARDTLPAGYQFGDAGEAIEPIVLRQRVFGVPNWRVEIINGEPRLVRLDA